MPASLQVSALHVKPNTAPQQPAKARTARALGRLGVFSHVMRLLAGCSQRGTADLNINTAGPLNWSTAELTPSISLTEMDANYWGHREEFYSFLVPLWLVHGCLKIGFKK